MQEPCQAETPSALHFQVCFFYQNHSSIKFSLIFFLIMVISSNAITAKSFQVLSDQINYYQLRLDHLSFRSAW